MKFTRERLIDLLIEALDLLPEDAMYAIGGAEAMAEHGYSRFTEDVDVFVMPENRREILRGLRDVGLEIYRIHGLSHWGAKIPGDPDPNRRIDVLVPHSEPELSAVEFAVATGDRGWRVMPPNLLAMVKFYAYDDSADIRHAHDLASMYHHAIFDPIPIRKMIAHVDPDRIDAWDSLMEAFQAPEHKPSPRKRLDPDEFE